jgi:hypothetical protein
MAFFLNKDGNAEHIQIDAALYAEAKKEKKSVPQLLNSKFHAEADLSKGSPFAQLCASEGLITTPQGANPFGLRSPTIAEILDGKSGFEAASGTNVQQKGSPYGSQSRNLFPAAVIAAIESAVDVDRTTDSQMFDRMIGQRISIGGDTFEQPVINYTTPGEQGPMKAKAQRVTQLGTVPTLLQITTSDKPRRLPTYGIGIEMSDQATKTQTLDLVAMTVKRYMEVEKDQRVYNYISSLYLGDNDMVIGSVPPITSTSLDANATGGVITHKAWVKWLTTKRKSRKITHAICDIDTYLKIEARAGRPGLSAYDPRLPIKEAQARVSNLDFQDVDFFIVDSAAEGGPVPAGEVWGLDARKAITSVSNTEADYQATEAFILRRSSMMVMHWSQEVYRTFGDSELTPFTRLIIS